MLLSLAFFFVVVLYLIVVCVPGSYMGAGRKLKCDHFALILSSDNRTLGVLFRSSKNLQAAIPDNNINSVQVGLSMLFGQTYKNLFTSAKICRTNIKVIISSCWEASTHLKCMVKTTTMSMALNRWPNFCHTRNRWEMGSITELQNCCHVSFSTTLIRFKHFMKEASAISW
jgi:hypothetical protein